MNKLKILGIALISSVLMAVSSNAIEVRVGVSAGYAQLEAAGSETLKTTSVVTTHTEQANAMIPSVFAELAMDNGFGFGYDRISGSADLAGQAQKHTNVLMGIGNPDGDTGTQEAQATVDGVDTLYLIKTFQNGLLIKYGSSSADVITKETLATGAAYGNASMDGTMMGLGFEHTNDSGVFLRTSVEHIDFDDIKLTATADADGLSNVIKANVDVTLAKISLGKKF